MRISRGLEARLLEASLLTALGGRERLIFPQHLLLKLKLEGNKCEADESLRCHLASQAHHRQSPSEKCIELIWKRHAMKPFHIATSHVCAMPPWPFTKGVPGRRVCQNSWHGGIRVYQTSLQADRRASARRRARATTSRSCNSTHFSTFSNFTSLCLPQSAVAA